MKILFLSAANDIHTVRWVNELIKKGHDVNLIFCSNHSPSIHKIDKRVKLNKLMFKSGIGYYLNYIQLKNIYTNYKPDIVNAHYASGYGTLARISKLKPLVLSVWGADVYDFPHKSKVNMSIIKKNLNYANKIASTSNVMAKRVKELLNNNELKVEITPFGVDINKFKQTASREEKKKNEISIGIVKRVSEKYGIKYLIEAIEILINKYKDSSVKIKLQIYGNGDQKEELEKMCKKKKIDKFIDFKGAIPNDQVPNALNELDIFALSSIEDSESFGVAAVEAMAVGLPVVATDVDGFREVVDHNVTGYIVERKNSLALANALDVLINDSKLRKSMGNSGKKRVEELYIFEKNVNEMIRIYNEVKKSYDLSEGKNVK